MTARQLTAFALAAVALIAGVLVVRGGGEDERYAFRFDLENASGLRDGTILTEGGVDIGDVEVDLADNDKVQVTARMDDGQGPIGKDAKLYISSVNLLGQKRLEVDKGDISDPAPDGARIPASRVRPSTDLDQVLAVLDPDTRARVQVLINEAGAAVVGRRTDISKLVSTLPSTIDKATKVVDGVVGDTQVLSDLVRRSDGLVREVVAERQALGGMIDSAGQAAQSASTKRTELLATLDRAPATLRTLRGFLGELERTTVPLGPAARDIAKVAPVLRSTLAELEPFQKEAAPTLDAATKAAPMLSRLASGATPVVRRATPTVARLSTFATELVPASTALEGSTDNLIATIDNWSRAVQLRDGLSHIFRGEPAATPQTGLALLYGVLQPTPKKAADKATRKPAARRPKAPAAEKPAAPAAPKPKLPTLPIDVLPGLQDAIDDALGEVGGTLDGVLGGLKTPGAKDGAPKDTAALLDFLLKP